MPSIRMACLGGVFAVAAILAAAQKPQDYKLQGALGKGPEAFEKVLAVKFKEEASIQLDTIPGVAYSDQELEKLPKVKVLSSRAKVKGLGDVSLRRAAKSKHITLIEVDFEPNSVKSGSDALSRLGLNTDRIAIKKEPEGYFTLSFRIGKRPVKGWFYEQEGDIRDHATLTLSIK